jgi:hypothetical protein
MNIAGKWLHLRPGILANQRQQKHLQTVADQREANQSPCRFSFCISRLNHPYQRTLFSRAMHVTNVVFSVEIVHVCNLLSLQPTVTEYTCPQQPRAVQTVEAASAFSLIFDQADRFFAVSVRA